MSVIVLISRGNTIMLKLLLGDPNTRKLKRYQPIVEEINFLEEEISGLTDDELRSETNLLKERISSEFT